MAENLLRKTWSNLDSHELRLLLDKRIGGAGQFDSRDANPRRLYRPLAGESCRVAITFRQRDKKIIAVERGPAFDAAEWKKIAEEIENAILAGLPKVGRDFSFSSLPVPGSWCGSRSGVQILPPAPGTPSAHAAYPFVLEFPIDGAPDDLLLITYHRRRREHRRLTLLLNALLRPRISFESGRSEHFWAHIPAAEGTDGNGESRRLQRFFYAPLDPIVTNALSAPAAEKLAEIQPEKYYFRHDYGMALRIPADLDDSLCRYRELSEENRSKFDRAAFWFDLASRQWTISVSASFASLVSAIESLTDRGSTHLVFCEQCKASQSHDAPGAAKSFQSFLETHAPGASLSDRRNKMYHLRSRILHGNYLMQMDQTLDVGLNPAEYDEWELQSEFWSITGLALRNWLRACEDRIEPPSSSQHS